MFEIEERLQFPEGKGRADFLRADGIWDFVAETGAREAAVEPETTAYQGKYQTIDSAASYNTGYRQRKQRRTQREFAILRRLLAGHAGAECLLDMPCGGGRLSPVMAEYASAMIEMDLSLGQLQFGREDSSVAVPRAWVRGSGFQIPLRDGAVEGACCIRLSHHLYSLEEKEKLLAELLRVVRSFVIFSFVDSCALKYVLRRLRHRLSGKAHRTSAIAVKEVAALARRHGGELVACPAIGVLQAHRYAGIRKVGS